MTTSSFPPNVQADRLKVPDWVSRSAIVRWALHGRLLLSAALSAAVFVIDVRVPRTAIPAICYSGLLALVASAGVRPAIIPTACLFTVLTWVGLIFEPAGSGMLWASVVDRGMVSGVLWLTAVLMLRREQDLAALETLSRELSRRNGELDQFAGVVAHDIRSPLATATLYAELLAMTERAGQGAGAAGENGADEDAAQAREVIVRSLREMDELIRNLLEATRRPQPRADCSTQAVLQRVLRTMQAELQTSGARVAFDSAMPVVHADEAQVRQVFQNLIQNSIKYRSPERAPVIHVTAARGETHSDQPGHWTFCVRDNGMGVRPEDATRIFERYGRATGASGRAGGVGLGLSVCKRIIEQHGGRIWVEPGGIEPGVGTSFCFTLPGGGEG